MITDKTIGAKVFDISLIFILIVVTITCVLPIWYTLVLSFSSSSAATAGRVWLWPVDFNLRSYQQLVKDSQFFESFWISIQRVVLGAALNLIVVVLTAYPLSKTSQDFRFRNFFMWTLVFVMVFNGGLIPMYLTVKSYGLINSVWALVLTGGAHIIVFYVILTVNFFRNLPKELEEAAIVDGAGPWYTLIKVHLPLSVPVLATVTLFCVVYHWNDFFYGLIFMTREEYYPLQTYIKQMVIPTDPSMMSMEQYEKMSALSNRTLNAAKIFIAMIPVLFVYPFIQRYFIHGITLGSVKE
jgi:multiple sugar transport system permease protein/putative aldouronate transport system permease protein